VKLRCSVGIGLALRAGMALRIRGRAADDRWERLQTLLLALQPGHVVTVSSLAKNSGVEADAVEMVLRALTRASLFQLRGPATFVRQRMPSDGG
jgi:hypothetical protein